MASSRSSKSSAVRRKTQSDYRVSSGDENAAAALASLEAVGPAVDKAHATLDNVVKALRAENSQLAEALDASEAKAEKDLADQRTRYQSDLDETRAKLAKAEDKLHKVQTTLA